MFYPREGFLIVEDVDGDKYLHFAKKFFAEPEQGLGTVAFRVFDDAFGKAFHCPASLTQIPAIITHILTKTGGRVFRVMDGIIKEEIK